MATATAATAATLTLKLRTRQKPLQNSRTPFWGSCVLKELLESDGRLPSKPAALKKSNYRSFCWRTKSTKETQNLIGVKHAAHNDATGTNGQLLSFSSRRIDTCPPGISDTRRRASADAARGIRGRF